MIDGWQLQRMSKTQGKLQTWLCNPVGHPQVFRAQVLVDSEPDSPERERFERKAAISSMLPAGLAPTLLHSNLDADNPLQVYPLEPSLSLQSWLEQQSQWPSGSTMLTLASQSMHVLGALHELGYAFIDLSLKCFLVDATPEPRIWLGELENCDGTWGHSTDARGQGSFSARNSGESHYGRSLGEFKCDFRSKNIAQAAQALAALLGPGFQNSQLARAMTHADPQARPTASQILPLLLDLETEMTGVRRDVA